MEDPPTPRIQELCFRLAVLSSDLALQLGQLTRRLGVQTDECLVLSAALHNVVDRKKEKERHKKRWKIELKELLDTEIDGVESL
jgi:hypothetical protein